MNIGDRVRFTGTYLDLREQLHLHIDTSERIDASREGTVKKFHGKQIALVKFDCESYNWEVYIHMLEVVESKKQLKLIV